MGPEAGSTRQEESYVSEIRDVIAANLGETAEETAQKVITELQCPQRWAELFWPLLVDECAGYIRAHVRRAERTFVAGGKRVDPTAKRAEFLNGKFSTMDGRFPTWETATVEDHQLRIGNLLKMRDGIDETIALHKWAITTITAAGVSCLGEIPDLDLPPALGAAA